MPKDSDFYLTHILAAIGNVESYTAGFSYPEFAKNRLVSDAVVRNLEVIGEAVKNLPPDFKKEHKELGWKKIAGFRDIAIHHYFGVDLKIVWDIVKNEVPKLKGAVERILER